MHKTGYFWPHDRFNDPAFMKGLLSKALSGNRKNLIILSGGSMISQIIPFFISPFLTRLFSPDQFAVLELVLRFASFFAVMSTLRFDIAIPLPREDRKAADLFMLATISSLLVSLLALLLFFIFRYPLLEFLENPDFEAWMFWVPVLIFFGGFYQSCTHLLLRLGSYRELSTFRITDSLLNGVGKIGLALLVSTATLSLILPNFIAQVVVALLPLFLIGPFLRNNLTFSSANLKARFREYIEFPKVNLPNALADVMQISLVVVLISHFFGAAALGFYALKLRVLKTPTLFLGNSAGQIFYRTASSAHAKGEPIRPMFLKYFRYFILAGIPIFLPIAFAGPWIFEFVFGKEWVFAGELAQITTPWMYFNFLASALSYMPVILKKQATVLLLSTINFVAMILGLVAGYYIFEDFKKTIMLVAGIETVYFMLVNAWYYRIASK